MFVVFLLHGLMVTAPMYAGGGDGIVGIWNTAEKDAKIEIYPCGTKYCGKIVWLKDPIYPTDSKDGKPGTPVLDTNNPDPSHKNDPILGLQMLFNFEYVGSNMWTGGKIYDSDNGKTYGGRMELLSHNQLKLRGFLGVSLFGGSTVWTRDREQEQHEY